MNVIFNLSIFLKHLLFHIFSLSQFEENYVRVATGTYQKRYQKQIYLLGLEDRWKGLAWKI